MGLARAVVDAAKIETPTMAMIVAHIILRAKKFCDFVIVSKVVSLLLLCTRPTKAAGDDYIFAAMIYFNI